LGPNKVRDQDNIVTCKGSCVQLSFGKETKAILESYGVSSKELYMNL
ncbi:hypothetical protein GWI33_009628, partial [Rhynchophorus ferrugineus]